MTNDKPTASDKLNYTLALIKSLPPVITERVGKMDHIQQGLDELDGRTCTGNVHWRDKDTPGKTAKLYILHRTDRSCPIHGRPSPGGRMRSYVGNKPDKISDALAAIERERERRDLQRELHTLQEIIGRASFRIKNIYWVLHYTVRSLEQYMRSPEIEIAQMETE